MNITQVSLIAFALVSITITPAISATGGDGDRDQIVALAHQVVDAFNKGDITSLKALAPAESIMDEMPPFSWRGPGAMDAFLVAVEQDNTRMKDTDGFSVLGPPTYIRVEGDVAYAVFPDHFRYNRAGVKVNEDATVTFNARRTPDGWRVVALTYSAAAH
jgi:hypothetical protein